jgi:hypothetical protein
LHTCAHKAQIALACRLLRTMPPDARRQTAAQSVSSFMRSAISVACSSHKREATQWSQAVAHASQAEMQG